MEAAEAGNDGLPVEGATKRESDSDESVDLEVESNASETTVSCAVSLQLHVRSADPCRAVGCFHRLFSPEDVL